MSMNINMNQKVASALMCALLCTGDLSAAVLNQASAPQPHNSSVAHYQLMQSVLSSDDVYDDFDDDDPEEDTF